MTQVKLSSRLRYSECVSSSIRRRVIYSISGDRELSFARRRGYYSFATHYSFVNLMHFSFATAVYFRFAIVISFGTGNSKLL